MLETSELYALARALSQRKVLSIYLDNRVTDPSRRHAWRAALVTGLRSARQSISDAAEQTAFDQAAAFQNRWSAATSPLNKLRSKPLTPWMVLLRPRARRPAYSSLAYCQSRQPLFAQARGIVGASW